MVMSFGQALLQLLIGPLQLIYEFVFYYAKSLTNSIGFAIIVLSIVVNFMLLPLYQRADAIQDEERAQEKRMEHWVNHIKKTFSGNERFMMLQTYYRQNNYKPYYALKGLLPLVLEIPFFMAAYRYLSGLSDLRLASFGPIRDLSVADGLLVIGDLRINVLPILMTLINIISSAIYTKGLRLKDKLQLYGMALLFLVLLYGSPSGLVVYWTMNNLFSLIKNVVVKLFKKDQPEQKAKKAGRFAKERPAPSFGLFFGGCVFLTLLTGVLIPSAVIQSSPSEFVFAAAYRSPMLHILSSFLLAAGLFMGWLSLFYALSGVKAKRVFGCVIWVLSGIAVVSYMFFGGGFGTLTSELIYEVEPVIPLPKMLLNIGVLAALGVGLALLWGWKPKLTSFVYPVLCVAVLGMAAVNLIDINKHMPEIRAGVAEYEQSVDQSETDAERSGIRIPLSREGKNVIVLMLDRAISSFVPYMMAEMPQLQEQFAGFTYYPSTISFGVHTNFAAPALFGGYEYTPEALNARNLEPISQKHGEAIMVMPMMFNQGGYEVTVIDPVYANYKWVSDLSFYDRFPFVHAYMAQQGQFNTEDNVRQGQRLMRVWDRCFFLFGVMKSLPYALQPVIYQNGTYFCPDVEDQAQTVEGTSVARGSSVDFMNSFKVLEALPEITEIRDGDQNTFLVMENDTTHNDTLLQEPEYTFSPFIDNTEYDKAHAGRFTLDGRTMNMNSARAMRHYQMDMAAFLQLGKWLDYLRENGVYDNTRIIIVSDHGTGLNLFPEWELGEGLYEEITSFNPLLMVKDFDSTEFTVDERFMTNADVPILAAKDLVPPINPFTGNFMSEAPKQESELYIFDSHEYNIYKNNGTTFIPGPWYVLQNVGDMFNADNWRMIEDH